MATEALPVAPEKIRLVVWVQAKGKDAKSAITALNEQKARVKKDLESMKAEVASIKFSPSRVAADETNQQQVAMMGMQIPGRGNAKPVKPPTVFLAKCAVKAEWSLPVSEGDALAILPANLLEQVKARDIEGKNNKPMLDGDAQEQLDEMETMMHAQYSPYGGAGGPEIMFVGKVSNELVEQVTQKAFQSAVKKAEMISKSSSLTLGKIMGVNKQQSLSETSSVSYAAMGYPTLRGSGYPSPLPTAFTEVAEGTVVAPEPDELFYRATVIVSFGIQ